MLGWANYVLVYLGAVLMLYNIYGFVQFARYLQKQKAWKEDAGILYLPIVLLVLFLIGYLTVAIAGNPDLVMAGILFGGSIFVFIMYKFLNSVTQRILENGRLEAELMAAEESNKAKTSFLASMSHEMRTPLNVILGMNGIAMKDPELSPDTRGRLEKVELSAQHLLGLINNMLDMNRIDAGMLAIKDDEFSLSEMLGQVNAIAYTLCEEKGLTYEAAVPEQDDCNYIGDSMQLTRVLLSIIDNAVKYTDAPGTVRFGVERTADEGMLQKISFTVADTGIGMDEEFLSKIFGAFAQEDASSTSRFGGTGLSLAIAKNIAEFMGGTITVESKKGVGTTFTVVVKLMRVGLKQAPGAQDGQDAPVSLDGLRVLIVEDLPENAEIVADLLELEGVETEHAENGQIALDMIETSPEAYYDAVLMDLRMPVMDGLEATRRIRAMDRADAKALPIVALTANAAEEDVKQSLEAGMNVHLAKPADAEKLYETLGILVRQSSKPGEGAEA